MKNYTILVTAALPLELKTLKELFKTYDILGVSFLYFCTGVGNYKTISQLQDYLVSHNPDFILNIGICGKRSDSINSEMFQVCRIKNLANERESIPPLYISIGNLESIACSEVIVTNPEVMLHEKYVDMESYGIDFVAKKQRIAYIILKIPFDTVSPESKSVDVGAIETSIKLQTYVPIIKKIHSWCQKNIQELPDWNYYATHFRLTVTEVEKFKKAYYKLTAFDRELSDFFEQHKNLSKQEFFQEIEKIRH